MFCCKKHFTVCMFHFCTQSIISGSATIIDDVATVTVSSLQCEGTYSITAGGIIDQTLDGPRFHTETIIAGACPVILSTTSLRKKIFCTVFYLWAKICMNIKQSPRYYSKICDVYTFKAIVLSLL